MSRLRIIPLDDTVAFPGMPITLPVDVGGDDRVSRYLDPATNEDYDVQLRLERQYRSDADTISRLYVSSQSGGLVRLDNVVKIEQGQAPSRIANNSRATESGESAL